MKRPEIFKICAAWLVVVLLIIWDLNLDINTHTHTLKETQRRNKRNLFEVCYWFFFLDLELIFIWIVCQSSETETDDDMAADDLPQDENRVNVFYEQLGKANRERTCRSTSKTPPSRYVFWNRSRIRWVIFRMIFLLLDITWYLYPGGGFKDFLFSSLPGEDSHFDKYFSDGLKPPTSYSSQDSRCWIFSFGAQKLPNFEVSTIWRACTPRFWEGTGSSRVSWRRLRSATQEMQRICITNEKRTTTTHHQQQQQQQDSGVQPQIWWFYLYSFHCAGIACSINVEDFHHIQPPPYLHEKTCDIASCLPTMIRLGFHKLGG